MRSRCCTSAASWWRMCGRWRACRRWARGLRGLRYRRRRRSRVQGRVSLFWVFEHLTLFAEKSFKMASLEGKTALVTGASQGIGRACAITLAKAGAKVALAARNEAKLNEVAAEIAAAGGTAQTFALDLASEESIKAGAKAALAHFGSIEIL